MKLHNNTDTALLLVRVGLALVFMAHGWDKIVAMSDTVTFFSSIGLSPVFAYLVAYTEFIGGLAMLLGVFTGWAGILLAITMLGAIGKVKLNLGFVGGYEFDLVLFLSAIAISLSGAGKYTVVRLWKKA